jgi:hypothetical protein
MGLTACVLRLPQGWRHDARAVTAQITSSASDTQFAASQHFYLPIADRPGAWSIGSGLDGASFTIDATTGIHSINANAAGDGSVQLTKSFNLVFTPTDGSGAVTQTRTITLLTIAAPGSASLSYVGDFTGTAGRALETLPGWSISGSAATTLDTPQTDGAGGLRGTGGHEDNAGQWACLYNPSGSVAGDTITFKVSRGDADDYNTTRFMVAATDFQNGMFFGLYLKNTNIDFSVGNQRRQGATVTSVAGYTSGGINYRVDGTADVIFTHSLDGNTLTATVVGDTTTTITYDLTGTTKGPKFGFGGAAAYNATLSLGKHVKAITFVRPVTTLALTVTPTYSVTNQATYTATWSGTKPTQLRHRFKNDVGAYVTPWMVGDTLTNTGTTSGTITYLATAPSSGGLTIEVAPLNDIAVIVTAATPTYFLANVLPFQQGFNVRGPNYYQPIPWDNNWGPCCAVQSNRIYLPHDAIEGYANLTITPSSTVITGSSADVTIISNDGAGHLRVNITTNTGGIATRYIGWSGSTPTSLNVVRDGVTGRTPIEWINGVRGQWLRDLDAAAVNFVPVNSDLVRNTLTTGFWQNDAGTGPDVPYQIAVDAIAAKMAADPNFIGYWGVLGADIPLEGVGIGSVRDRAKYEAATLPTRTKRAIEIFNEFPWNSPFTGNLRGMADAVRKGYYGAATLGNLQPALNVRVEGGGTPENLVTTADVAAGDHIIANIYGIGDSVYRAKQFAPSGTHVASGTTGAVTENAYFTLLSIDIAQAGKRYQMARMKAVLDIYRQEWGTARFDAQIVPVLMGQAGGSLYNDLSERRTFDPATFALIKGTGYAYYHSPAAGANPATVTAAQLAAQVRANFPTIQQSVRQAVVDSLRMGKIPMFYEGMTGPDDALYKGTGNYVTQWDAMMASDDGRTIMSDIAFFMKSTVPGVVIGYDLVGARPWSLMANWRDTANKRLVGYFEGLALAPMPPPSPPPAPLPVPAPPPPQQGTGVTTIPIYGGPLKRDIIKSAYGATGQSVTEFELTAEEYAQGLRLLNMVLARWAGQWGVDLGYNFPPPGSLGSADEESGIPFAAEDVVVQTLARQIAPNIGKTMGADAARNYAEAMLALRSTYAKIPPMQMQSDTPRGAGSRRCRWFGPFFSTNRPDDEIIQ